MNTTSRISRRNFLKTTGAIVIGFSWSVPGVLAQQAAPARLPLAPLWRAGGLVLLLTVAASIVRPPRREALKAAV